MSTRRGEIPGFYFDEGKKKYFRIQANHLAPSGAKYARGTVKQERRLVKKRKTEMVQKARREKHTVKRAPSLLSPIVGGIGLEREHGLDARYLSRSDEALVSQWRPTEVHITLPGSFPETRLQDAYCLPAPQQMLFASRHAHSGISALYISDWDDRASSTTNFQVSTDGLAAFNSAISSISTGMGPLGRTVLACASAPKTGNVFFGALPEPGYEADHEEQALRGSYLTLSCVHSSLTDSSIHAPSGKAAIMGFAAMSILDQNANLVNAFSPSSNDDDIPAPCVNWLDSNTVLYGARGVLGWDTMLWDTRTANGKSPRFKVKERLTGVLNPTVIGDYTIRNDHEILASTNYGINLFDTRMPGTPKSNRIYDTPLLSFAHKHGGPRLQAAANGCLIAAADEDNIVQVYSTRSGRKVGSLAALETRGTSPLLRRVMWYDDSRGRPTLQAVRGDAVVRWSWGGYGDDDDSP